MTNCTGASRTVIEVKSAEDGSRFSLRWAMEKAHELPLSTIPVISLSECLPETICLRNGELHITRDLFIVNKRPGLTISAGGNSRILRIAETVHRTKITSSCGLLTLADGRADNGAAILVNGTDHQLILSSVRITKCKASNFGGAVYSMSAIVLKNAKIDCNEAGLQGGGLWINNGVFTVSSSIESNYVRNVDEAASGGGIYSNIGNVVLDGTSVTNNMIAMNSDKTNGGAGGGVTNITGSTWIQNGSKIDGNKSFNAAGLNQGKGDIYLTSKSSISGNQSYNDGRGLNSGGAGIVVGLGTVYMTDSKICNNKALGMYCGGIVSLFGDVFVKNSDLSGNSNNGPGGAIALNIGSTCISDSALNNNTCAALGGAVVSFTPSPGFIGVTNSTMKGNTVTNGETIRQVIEAFLGVVQPMIEGMVKQANANPVVSPNPFDQYALKIIQVTREIVFPDFPEPNAIAGGCIASLTTGSVIVNGCTVECNTVGKVVTHHPDNYPFRSFGGGFFCPLASVTAEKSSVKGNRANTLGGGIFAGVIFNVTDSTVSGNQLDGRENNIYNGVDSQSVFIRTKVDRNTIENLGKIVTIN